MGVEAAILGVKGGQAQPLTVNVVVRLAWNE